MAELAERVEQRVQAGEPSQGPAIPRRLVAPDAPGVARVGLERVGDCRRAYAWNLLARTRVADFRDGEDRRSVLATPLFLNVLRQEGRAAGQPAPDAESALAGFVARCFGKPVPVGPLAQPLAANLELLGRCLGLRKADRAVLQFLAAQRLSPQLDAATTHFVGLTPGDALELVAVATGLAPKAVAAALAPEGPLLGSGLVGFTELRGYLEQVVRMDARLLDLLTRPRLTAAEVRDAFAPAARPATCRLPDFAHLGPALERVRALLEAALRRRAPGVNVLLHGPSGAGKTELASVLAASLRADLRAAGSKDREGFYPSPPERFKGLQAGNALFGRARTLLLLDEMEDLFDAGEPRAGLRTAKVWFHEVLETNPVPTIWIANEPQRFDPAILRRFSLVLELPALPPERKAATWASASAGALPPEAREELARRFDVSAAEMAGAVRTARLIGRGGLEVEAVAQVLSSGERLRGGRGGGKAPAGEPRYRLDLVNASLDVGKLAARLAAWVPDGAPLTLCLHGPPGTGKSEYVRHLAVAAGRPLLVRRPSDIESKWVGEAEKALARAFQEAERTGAVLLFDEVDSFLRDRRKATQRHEVTLTNEFLQLLERHRGVVAFTTNMLEELDPAVLRRIPLKVEFRPLRAEQARALFGVYFPGVALDEAAAARLDALASLTPGDFAVAARTLQLVGDAQDAGSILARLAEEVALRAGAAGGPRAPLGFSA